MTTGARSSRPGDGPARWGRRGAVILALVAALAVTACGGADVPPEVVAAAELERGVELLEGGHLDPAFDTFTDVIAKDPANSEAFARRAFIHMVRDEFGHAVADLDRAFTLDPELALAHKYQGLLLAALGNHSEAILAFTRAIDLAPGATGAYLDRSRLYLNLGDVESALADLETAGDMDPDDTGLLLTRAQVYILAGDRARAEADLHRVLSLSQDESVVTAARQILASIP